MKILIVEDDRALRFLYEEELKEEGYEVLTAGTGEEALLQLEVGNPDLIILDMGMPGMNGIEVLRRMVGKDRKFSVILNGSYPGYRQDSMSWGADACIVKSADLGELKKKIRELRCRSRCGASQ
jgi:DNA-binding response OmpR family regulator